MVHRCHHITLNKGNWKIWTILQLQKRLRYARNGLLDKITAICYATTRSTPMRQLHETEYFAKIGQYRGLSVYPFRASVYTTSILHPLSIPHTID